MPKAKTADEYIKALPKPAQTKARELRAVLRAAVPKAKENFKWGSPVFETTRILFAFAAYKDHLNFAPTPATLRAFAKELKAFKLGKGTVHLPYDRPIPKTLIKKMARHRAKDLAENDAKWM